MATAELGYLIVDGLIKALLLGVKENVVRDSVRALAPEEIPAALEKLCEEASVRAHEAVDALPDDPVA